MTKDIFDLVASLEADPDRPRAPTFRRPETRERYACLPTKPRKRCVIDFPPPPWALGVF
jgi:hypothetical protein